ncbi:MAG: hypothetical protein PHD04_00575 [Candidatus Pacebacteria bacterium]|nr:hypothetical protein [Candidatus Paceibacterota bacterium]
MTTTKWMIGLVLVILIGLGVYVFIIPHIPGQVALNVGDSVFSLDRNVQLRLDSINTDGDDTLMVTVINKGQVDTLKFTPAGETESFGEYNVRLCGALPPSFAEFAVTNDGQAPVCAATR